MYVEYYNNSLPLRIYHVTDWELPDYCDDKVISVVFTFQRDGRSYTNRILGYDYYSLSGDYLYFWTDPSQPWASPNRVGSRHNVLDGSSIDLTDVPTLSSRIRYGVMVPDNHARELGLI